METELEGREREGEGDSIIIIKMYNIETFQRKKGQWERNGRTKKKMNT